MRDARLPRPAPREAFRTRLRAELLREAVALAEERRLRGRSLAERLVGAWTVGRLRPALVAATLVAVLVAGTGAAAAGSLPGDPAFELKRAVEGIELALAPTDEAKVGVLARQAQRRLDELARAAERPDKAPTASEEYEAAVARFAAAVEALRAAEPGEKHEAVEQIVEAAREKHVPVLEQLRDRLPEEAQQGIERALEEHGKLAPADQRQEHPAKPSERPGRAPTKSDAPARTPEGPRATETQRGGRPSVPPGRP